MKKAILFLFFCIIALLTWVGESRSFYCFGDARCITVWKTYNNICYIIPGRYYSLIRPSSCFIKTTNTNYIDIFFTKKFPNQLIFKEEGDIESKQYIQLKNENNKNEYIFINYDQDEKKWDKVFYKSNAKKFNDLNDDADFIEIDIKENIAEDKNGNKL